MNNLLKSLFIIISILLSSCNKQFITADLYSYQIKFTGSINHQPKVYWWVIDTGNYIIYATSTNSESKSKDLIWYKSEEFPAKITIYGTLEKKDIQINYKLINIYPAR